MIEDELDCAPVQGLLDTIVSEAMARPFVDDTRGLVAVCQRLLVHSELHHLSDQGLIDVARAIGSIPTPNNGNEAPILRIPSFEYPESVPAGRFRILSEVTWNVMRLFGLFDRARLSRLQEQLLHAFTEGQFQCARFKVPENPYRSEMFPSFLALLAGPEDRDQLEAFVSRTVVECGKRNKEWLYSALQLVTRNNARESVALIDRLEEAYSAVSRHRESTVPTEERYFLDGYFHPLHFEQRRQLLGIDPSDARDLASVATTIWTVPGRFGATFLYPPGWFWLEYWEFEPWHRLERFALEQLANNSQKKIDWDGLKHWLWKSWNAWAKVNFSDAHEGRPLIAPFKEPWKFRR